MKKPISNENFTLTVKKHINNETKNELDKEIIGRLDIPSGLKELLVSHNLNVEKVLNMKSSDIAEITSHRSRRCTTDIQLYDEKHSYN